MAETQASQTDPAISAKEALDEDEWYDLLPIEKKLVGYSLSLGVVLLVIFILSFGVFK